MNPISLSATVLFIGYFALADLAKPVHAELATAEKKKSNPLLKALS